MLYVFKHLYFFGTMSKTKILSYFQHETDKIIHEAEEKTENKFHEEENGTPLLNSKPHNFQMNWLNEHKWLRYENNATLINYALSPAIAYLSLCKGNRGTNCHKATT